MSNRQTQRQVHTAPVAVTGDKDATLAFWTVSPNHVGETTVLDIRPGDILVIEADSVGAVSIELRPLPTKKGSAIVRARVERHEPRNEP